MRHIDAPRAKILHPVGGGSLHFVAFCGEVHKLEALVPGAGPVCPECQRRDALTRLGPRSYSACLRCGGEGLVEDVQPQVAGVDWVPPKKVCAGCDGGRVVVLLPQAEVLARGYRQAEVEKAHPSRQFWCPVRAGD